MKYTKKKSYKKPYVKRTYKKKYSKFGKVGYFKILRWSSNDSTNNCHFSLIGSDAVPSGENTTTFSLNHINGFGELVSLFDNYRIMKVLYRYVVTRNPSDNTGATANKGIYPRIVWTHDFNDSTPISRNLIYQRSNMREFYFGDNAQRTKWYTLKPAALAQMYESSTTTAYQPKWLQWLDTNDNTAPHYGIKFAYDNLYTGVTVRMEAKIIIECKGIS